MVREGVDYSRTGTADWDALAAAIKANGKTFVGRYAVNDKSPSFRGITAEEYQSLRAAGLDVFLYWQTTTNWMLNGYAAGVSGAINAQQNIVAAGIPADTPVYFACDFDATESDQDLIDECLRGAASVLGFERVGLYGGRWPITRAMQNRSARWFCQTTAWSGGVIVPGIHLYQYEYNQWYGGTNCDDVRAYQENFGQASYEGDAEPVKPAPTVPWGRDDVGVQTMPNGATTLAFYGEVKAKRNVPIRYNVGSGPAKPEDVFAEMAHGDEAIIRGSYKSPNGRRWAFIEINGGVGRAPLSAFTGPWPVLP